MKKKLKLFVWTEFEPDYTDGLAVALAVDETSAKKQVEKIDGTVRDWGTLKVYRVDQRMAAAVDGGG
jgi:hypothetical protein